MAAGTRSHWQPEPRRGPPGRPGPVTVTPARAVPVAAAASLKLAIDVTGLGRIDSDSNTPDSLAVTKMLNTPGPGPLWHWQPEHWHRDRALDAASAPAARLLSKRA